MQPVTPESERLGGGPAMQHPRLTFACELDPARLTALCTHMGC